MATTHIDTIRRLAETLDDHFGGVSEYRHYSGRAMFGKTCIGITVPWSLRDELVILARRRKLPNPCWDDMGRGAIAYWPGIEDPRENRHEEL